MSIHQYSLDLTNFTSFICNSKAININLSSLNLTQNNKLIITAKRICADDSSFHTIYFTDWPIATVIAICFASMSILAIFILKIIYSSTDEFINNNNKYDLIVFKAPPSTSQKNNCAVTHRKMFENDVARQHNKKALAESGFVFFI